MDDDDERASIETQLGMAFTPAANTPEGRCWQQLALADCAIEHTPLDKVDYCFKNQSQLSYSQLRTQEEAASWLQRKHPEWHTGMLRIWARSMLPAEMERPPPPPRAPRQRHPAEALATFAIKREKVAVVFD